MTKYRSNQDREVPLTLTVGQAAEMLGISEYLAWQMVKQSKLPAIRFGRLVRIPRARLITMVNDGPHNV